MKHPSIEYITACDWCEIYKDFVKSLALVNPEITVRVYDDCTDPECLAKYGMQSKSIIIINEQKAVTTLSKKAVRKAFDTALKSLK